MKSSDIPAKIVLPFGNSAVAPYIRDVPVNSQIGVEDGAASYTTGFPPLNFSPLAAGGVPPFGADFNGLLKPVSGWSRWQAAGGPVVWDATFAAAIGGYPVASIVASHVRFGYFFFSLADDNLDDPAANTGTWASWTYLGGATTGDVKMTLKAVADPGWIVMNDGTIGNAASGATTYAAADAASLFSTLWTNVSNTYAPVSSGRGATAAADFAANKTIKLLSLLGRALIVAGSGAGLTTRALGEGLGAETLAILQANLPNVTLAAAIASGQGSHTHADVVGTTSTTFNINGLAGGPITGVVSGGHTPTTAATLPAMTGTVPLGGSGTAISLMQPSAALNVHIKL